jgi:hypothetical protein
MGLFWGKPETKELAGKLIGTHSPRYCGMKKSQSPVGGLSYDNPIVYSVSWLPNGYQLVFRISQPSTA